MASYNLFSKMNVTNTSIKKLRRKYSSNLKSYTSTCQADTKLGCFDFVLCEKVKKITTSIVVQAKNQSLSPSSIIEVYGFLLEISQEAVKDILESKEDVRENEDLRCLVKAYFESTAKTINFCNTVENCVKKTESNKLIIDLAAMHFERESVNTEVGASTTKKYEKTLEELNKFKATRDPFDDEFMTQYASVYEEQVLLLEELRKQKVKLDWKLKNVKPWMRFSNAFFATAYVAVVVLSMVAVAMSAPPLLIPLVAVFAAPIWTTGQWFNKMLKGYEKSLKRRKGLVSEMEIGVEVNKVAMQNIWLDVDKLKDMISDVQRTVGFVLDREEDDNAMKLSMQEIKEKVNGYTKKIKEVGETAARCSQYIACGRVRVLEHILSLPSTNSVKW